MKRQNDIPKNSRTSAVTTDMPANTSDVGEVDHVERDRLVASGLGLVKVDGIDKRYIGLPPAIDEFNPVAEGEQKLSSQNTTFTSIAQVPFHPSIEIKDPTTGEFYFPNEDATSWIGCNHNGVDLVPPLPEIPPEGGNGGGGEPITSEKSFVGSGTVDLTVDELESTSAVTAVAIEGDAYPAPSYDVPNTTTLHSSDGVTVWEDGVNVLVTASWLGDQMEKNGDGENPPLGGSRKGDSSAGIVKGGTSGAEADSGVTGTSNADTRAKEKADKEKADKDAKDKAKK